MLVALRYGLFALCRGALSLFILIIVNHDYTVMRTILEHNMGFSLSLSRFLKRLFRLNLLFLVRTIFQQTHLSSVAHHDLDRLVIYFIQNSLAELLLHLCHTKAFAFLQLFDLITGCAVDDNLGTHR